MGKINLPRQGNTNSTTILMQASGQCRDTGRESPTWPARRTWIGASCMYSSDCDSVQRLAQFYFPPPFRMTEIGFGRHLHSISESDDVHDIVTGTDL